MVGHLGQSGQVRSGVGVGMVQWEDKSLTQSLGMQIPDLHPFYSISVLEPSFHFSSLKLEV